MVGLFLVGFVVGLYVRGFIGLTCWRPGVLFVGGFVVGIVVVVGRFVVGLFIGAWW